MTNQYTINEIVPHKGRMLLLDSILSVDMEKRCLTSQVTIGQQDTFFDKELEGVPSYVGFEYMAQSISALSALTAQSQTPRPGVILSVSNLVCQREVLRQGELVTVQVQENCKVGDLSTFDCIAQVEGATIVTCTLMVMEAESLEALPQQGE
ncbi:MAG: hypothetical protein IJC31_04565 [Spirochaetaceae bacterium]|nr:hypothetical protein [Spirochaetaceae bacterium]MBR2462251.1 hypothetical protein [Spirochaetaceae bacterium]